MAVIENRTRKLGQVKHTVWPSPSSGVTLANGDTGSPVTCDGAEKEFTVAVSGTFDGAVTIQGTSDVQADGNISDTAVWYTLTDLLGLPLTFTAAGEKFITETPLFIRPSVAAGSSANNVVTLVGR